MHFEFQVPDTLAVVPILIGPLSTLIALLPAILIALLRIFRPSGAKKLAQFFWHQKLFSCFVLAAIWFFYWGPEIAFLHRTTSASAINGATEWPLFRGGPARRGSSPDSEDPTVGDLVWNYTGEQQVYSSPTVVGNRVYVSTVVAYDRFKDRGAIECLNAETGEEIWRFSPRDYRATFSSPSVSGDYLVCGEGLHVIQDARIVCLDIKNGGKLLWEFQTHHHLESSACIYKDKVVIGAGRDGYYCVSLKPESDGKPKVFWHLDPKVYKECETPPLIIDDVVYAGVGGERRSSKGALLALSLADGKELWRLETPYPVFAPPASEEGKLYIGMGIGDFVNDAEEIRALQAEKMRKDGCSAAEIAAMEKEAIPAGEVWCVDMKTHQRDWKYTIGRAALGAVVPGERGVYFGSRDGNFYCVSKNGKLLNQFNAHEPIVTSPTLGKEHVYFSTLSGRMYCLRADSLELVWDMALGSGKGFMSSPTLANNHIYIGSPENGLRCMGRVSEKQAPCWRDGQRGGVVNTPFMPQKLDLNWRYPKDSAGPLAVTAPLLPHNGSIYAAGVRDQHAQLIKLKTAHTLDDAGRVDWTVPFNNSIVVPPAAVGTELYVVDGKRGQTSRALQCLDAEKGSAVWGFDIGSDASGQFAVDQKRVYVWSGAQKLTVTDRKTGRPVWSLDETTQKSIGAPALASGLVVLTTDSYLYVLDDESGARLVTIKLTEDPLFGATTHKNNILLETKAGLEVRNLANGIVVWASAVGPCTAPPVVAGDKVAVVTQSGDLIVFDIQDGKKIAQTAPVNNAVPPLWIAQNLVYVSAANKLMQMDLSTAAFSNWYDAGYLGQPCTPLIMLDQQLSYGSTTKGVLCLRPRKQ